MAGSHGDAPAVDLAALAICWLAVVFLFAGAVLLDAQRAFAARLGGAVPPVAMLVHAHERIGYWLLGIALVRHGCCWNSLRRAICWRPWRRCRRARC